MYMGYSDEFRKEEYIKIIYVGRSTVEPKLTFKYQTPVPNTLVEMSLTRCVLRRAILLGTVLGIFQIYQN